MKKYSSKATKVRQASSMATMMDLVICHFCTTLYKMNRAKCQSKLATDMFF